jgi:hypothetical protein
MVAENMGVSRSDRAIETADSLHSRTIRLPNPQQGQVCVWFLPHFLGYLDDDSLRLFEVDELAKI